jgi:hypothetical protein
MMFLQELPWKGEHVVFFAGVARKKTPHIAFHHGDSH